MKGREEASLPDQRARVRDACERDGLQLVEVIEEPDVSGGTPLAERDGLRRAIEAVEAGEVEVVVGAYLDRLIRSLKVQTELVERVEAAGGQVLAVDVGAITNGSAGQWLSSTLLGAVAEHQRRVSAERAGEAQARAVARGVAPYPSVLPGYVRGEDGILEPDPITAPIIAEAFQMRAGGATVKAVREFLAEHGIKRSYHGVTSLLGSRVVLGELHFGDLMNLKAHSPIVERETWKAVQRARVPGGGRAKSERLLARLGVLRCGSCGARMVVGSSNHGAYACYRCPPVSDCKARVTISGPIVEGIVVDAVRKRIAHKSGRASAETGIREAEQTLERSQAKLDAAIRALADLGDEVATRETLDALRESRDHAQQRLDDLGGSRAAVVIDAATDWDRLALAEKRDLIRAVVDVVEIAPGRGPDRVSVRLVG